MQVVTYSHTQLTAPGSSSAFDKDYVQAAGADMKVTVSSIDTSVIVRADYSDDSFSTTVFGNEVTISQNGTHVIPVSPHYKAIKPRFVSENGGTGAVIDIQSRFYY